MKRPIRRMAAAVAALALPLAAQALDYDIRRIDLSTGEIPLASIVAINSRGQLGGMTASGQVGILTGDTLVATTLPGRNPELLDLNDSGVALARESTGFSYGSYSNIYTFSAQGGLNEIQASKDLPYLAVGYPKLSNAGHVVMFGADHGVASAVVSQPNGSYKKVPYDYDGQALDINSSGVAVGSGQGGAVYWTAAGEKVMLGKMGGGYASLQYVTDSGLVLGSRSIPQGADPSTPTTFVYSLADGQTRFIDGIYASGIDEAGRVYGYTYVGGVTTYVVWDNGQLTDLSALLDGAPAGGIRAVSSDGRILMGGYSGLSYVLTPTPEPGTYVLMGVGLAAAAWGARRRRAA